MSTYRMSKGVTERYTSFAELGAAYGCKHIVRQASDKQTKDKKKLEEMRESFYKRDKHRICPACKQKMTYIGGNQLVCQNPECKGIKHEFKNETTGETKVYYSPAYWLLSDGDAEFAEVIFAEN